MLAEGVARELARIILPVNIYTKWYWTTDLHNLMHFLGLRLHEHAQWEARQYAEAVLKLAEPLAPIAFAAWRERA
jgi:thymidylate synthase (FAD)